MIESTRLGRRESAELDVGKWLAPPESERRPEEPNAFVRARGGACIVDCGLESPRVHGLWLERERIAGRLCDEELRRKRLPKIGDDVLERCHGRLRRALAPQLVDDPIPRKHLSRPQSEEGEHCPLLVAAKLETTTRSLKRRLAICRRSASSPRCSPTRLRCC